MGYSKARRLEILENPEASRRELIAALAEAADSVVSDLDAHPIVKQSHYLVGTGYDFAHFPERIAKKIDVGITGVACLWTTRCEVLGKTGDDVFALPQEFVEKNKRTVGSPLLLCASVIADKMEVLTHLIRIGPTVKPTHVVIVAALINTKVKQELNSFLAQYFNADMSFACDNEGDSDLRMVRDVFADTLDGRENKVIPVMSPWLLERRFGPRPDRTHVPVLGR